MTGERYKLSSLQLPRLVGVGLLLSGLLLNPWIIGWAFTDDGAVDRDSRVATIVLFQMFCLMLALPVMWPRARVWLAGYVQNVFAAAAILLLASAALVGSVWGIIAYRGAHHHTTGVSALGQPTEVQREWATRFVRECLASARRHGWFNFEQSTVDDFRLLEGDRAHYYSREFLFDDKILDADRPEFLMYRDTPRGKLLVGFMFFTRSLEEHGPLPGGALAQWHYHDWGLPGYCAEGGILPTGSKPDLAGRCVKGERVTRSAEMLHVWFVDHPLGPYADAMLFPDAKTAWTLPLLHPVVVHFTLALLIVAVGLDLLGKISGRPRFHDAAFMNLLLAAAAGIATIAAGMAAEVRLLIGHDVHDVLDTHKLLGFSACAGIVLLAAWRIKRKGMFPASLAWPYLAGGVVTVALAAGAGYFGSELVYVHGVAVQAVDRLALERYERAVFEEELGRPAATISPTVHVHDVR